MKNIFLFLLVLLASTSCTQQASLETTAVLSEAAAGDAGVSEERLMRIDAMLTEAIAQNQIPGKACSATIFSGLPHRPRPLLPLR